MTETIVSEKRNTAMLFKQQISLLMYVVSGCLRDYSNGAIGQSVIERVNNTLQVQINPNILNFYGVTFLGWYSLDSFVNSMSGITIPFVLQKHNNRYLNRIGTFLQNHHDLVSFVTTSTGILLWEGLRSQDPTDVVVGATALFASRLTDQVIKKKYDTTHNLDDQAKFSV
ncbi:hypothetical protein KC660_03000 [Candidatus Dojkabacteria bacterium]|uniref:Uncharacterized protein n=1 Tax=Candidatus Dojkabacteria bacterium TaxID=2099670 RepID=A0A955RI77_9BACT|nr:hypothetical protein [Candidatus Dojkabacteria bacterium]